MRRALGPFLTTGVALVAATVVVANPLAPPSRDMQISTTQLSTSPDLLSPSDKSLLSALTPPLSIEGIGPALAQILAALAADADRISREVNSESGPETQLAAGPPEQTAYRPEPVASTVVESPNATPVASSTGFTSTVFSTDVTEAINSLVADTSYLGGKVVEAAYAVVDVIIRVPQFVITAALDLLQGDIAGVLDTVKSAITAFFGPGLILLDGIRDVLYGRQPPPTPPPASASRLVIQSTATDAAQSATGGTVRPTRDGKAESARNHDDAPSAAGLRRITPTSKSTQPSSQPTTSTKASSSRDSGSSSKPATGSTHSMAGSARDVKSGAATG
ncbi:hypothetical protein ORI20_10590 [Mycobacterium sp. CVI_P3]|uniref:Uncharacterized protein n=1 Tax=Mycobacterium pinniadriaticum TaxID=2994102 RepID=A0ABT3SCB4_9MYCO|nr:hypothetical protein [Mycobacterium pinniadriaticum]MCX2930727.1 hypothetical protein [Mycobacterium pinniadriaticum]MCX2937151.1 hypothetical protein [Mycobacterium pinniadriaticum]